MNELVNLLRKLVLNKTREGRLLKKQIMSKTKVAFIGAGYMASEHLRAFASYSEVKLDGIFSRSLHRTKAIANQYPGLKIASSVDELWTITNADLVVIAVPILACKAICEQALKYKWALLIEKPVGYNLQESMQIGLLADKLNAKAYVALNRRFYGSTLQLQQRLKTIEGKRLVSILDQEDAAGALAEGQPLEVVHNWMFANSIHLIDYFTQFCRGEHLETKVLSPWQSESPDTVIAQLKFSSGDLGLYQAAWNAPGPWSVAVSTKQLRAELRPIEQLSLQRAGSRQIDRQPDDPLDQNFKPGLLRQAEAAIRAARDQTTSLATLAEANRSMKLVATIYGLT